MSDLRETELYRKHTTPLHEMLRTRVLVPVSGRWQVGDVVKSSTYGMWQYQTLDENGWRPSSSDEITYYEVVTAGRERLAAKFELPFMDCPRRDRHETHDVITATQNYRCPGSVGWDDYEVEQHGTLSTSHGPDDE